ncbi:MAG: MATE family efflux transporter [Lachnospiraceae bacterium]|nr:MATE family efflux transporter [Lachnospiraceae bacterium]
MKKKSSAVLMTEGSIWKTIIAFALPLFIGNFFQQLYNTADSLIVGNFLGSEALAAVSSSGSIIFLLVGFFNGIAMGAGVVVARYFGARDFGKLQRAIHTTITFGLVAGVLLTVIGVILTPQLLLWMDTPAEVLPNSILYFRIYFMGSMAFVLYNVFVGILQSLGDSTHPLQYLIISSIINVILDLLFVAVFKLGVGSVAFATIISQFISAVLCVIRLAHSPEEYRISVRRLGFDPFMLKQVIGNGLPAGMQNSIISFANIIVQSNINAFGKAAMAGCGSYSKIEGFGFLPITCFAMAMTTFVSQNLGAGKFDRIKKGARFGILCSMTMAELVGVIIYILIPVLLAGFNRDPEVIRFGIAQARTVTLFYCLLAFSHCAAGIFRGLGKAVVPMIVMLCCWCVIRITYITLTVRIIPVINVIFWAYPLTWTLSSICFVISLWKAVKKNFDLTRSA